MEIFINVPRLGNSNYPLVPNILEDWTGPQGYDWNSWAGTSEQVDGTIESSYFYGLEKVNNEDWIGEISWQNETNYARRRIFGISSDFQNITSTPMMFAIQPIDPGTSPLPKLHYKELPKGLVDAKNYYSQVKGLRLLNWTLPMIQEQSNLNTTWPTLLGKTADECWVPIHLRADLEQIAAEGWGMVEIHNELWNHAPWDWHETQNLYQMNRFPSQGWNAYTSEQREEYLNTRAELFREQGETALRLAQMGQRVVIGGQTANDAAYTISIAKQHMPSEWHENLNYSLGAYVGHGQNMHNALDQNADLSSLFNAALEDIKNIKETWIETQNALAERYGRPVPLHIYEGGIHLPAAGGAQGVNEQHLDLFQQMESQGMLEEIQAKTLEAAQEAGIESFALFQGPQPFQTSGLRGPLDFWTLDETHSGNNLKRILDSANLNNQDPIVDDQDAEQIKFDNLIKQHGAYLKNYVKSAADVLESQAPKAGAQLIQALRNVQNLI